VKLPNGDKATVALDKLTRYALDPLSRGKGKARVFSAALGFTPEPVLLLRSLLLEAACNCDAELGELNEFGQRYIIDFEVSHEGRRAIVRSAWIIDTGMENPRLISCYVR